MQDLKGVLTTMRTSLGRAAVTEKARVCGRATRAAARAHERKTNGESLLAIFENRHRLSLAVNQARGDAALAVVEGNTSVDGDLSSLGNVEVVSRPIGSCLHNASLSLAGFLVGG
jgi:hypothetical protein